MNIESRNPYIEQFEKPTLDLHGNQFYETVNGITQDRKLAIKILTEYFSNEGLNFPFKK